MRLIYRALIIMVFVIGNTMCSLTASIVSNVKAQQRYPWNGLVDVAFTITGEEGKKYDISFAAKDLAGATNLTMKTLRKCDGSLVSADKETLSPGDYHWIWDAGTDLKEGNSYKRVVVECSVVERGLPTSISGLVSWWPLSGDLDDASENGLHLSGVAPSWTVDRNGASRLAGNFIGDTPLSHTKEFEVSKSLTIVCWAKPTGIDNYPEGSYGPVPLGLGNMGMEWYNWSLIVFPVSGDQDSKVGVGLSVGKNRVAAFARSSTFMGAILDFKGDFGSRWHHFALVCEDALAPKLYVDGVLANARTSMSGRGYLVNAESIIAGGRFNASMNYSGGLGDVCIYNRALSAKEVRLLCGQDD